MKSLVNLKLSLFVFWVPFEGSSCKGQKITGFSKSKKHQLRKLDAVGKENLSYREGPMGCVGSDGEDALRPGTGSCRGFKSPKMVHLRLTESKIGVLFCLSLMFACVCSETLTFDADF